MTVAPPQPDHLAQAFPVAKPEHLQQLAEMNSEISHVPYLYGALGFEQIRVLVLEPSHNSNAPLRFSFHVDFRARLSAQYEAVSYVWGEPTLDHPLYHADGTRVLVTKNLDLALRRFRKERKPRWLWADAVCIDQSNLQEKGEQVRLMGQIFRSARRVLAWLGSGDTRVEKGIALVGDFSRAPKRTYADDAPITWDLIEPIVHLLDLEWFQRLWIVQECVLNTDCCLVYGTFELTFQRLISGMLRSQRRNPYARGLLSYKAWQSVIARAELWKLSCMIGTVDVVIGTLFSLVEEYHVYRCSNDHDRIFALYGLATDVISAKEKSWGISGVCMNIDYSVSVQVIYTAFAAEYLGNQMFFEVINAATRRTRLCSVDWPSWVPDWRVEPLQRRLCENISTQYSRLRKAPNFTIRASIQQNTLCLVARVSEIHRNGPHFLHSIIIEQLMSQEERSPAHFLSGLSQFCHGVSSSHLAAFLTGYFPLPEEIHLSHMVTTPAEMISTYLRVLRKEPITKDPGLASANAGILDELAWVLSQGPEERGWHLKFGPASPNQYTLDTMYEYARAMSRELHHCSFFRNTQSDGSVCFGQTPVYAQVGDEVLLLEGPNTQTRYYIGLVVRPIQTENAETRCTWLKTDGADEPLRDDLNLPSYRLIGEAAVYVSLPAATSENPSKPSGDGGFTGLAIC